MKMFPRFRVCSEHIAKASGGKYIMANSRNAIAASIEYYCLHQNRV